MTFFNAQSSLPPVIIMGAGPAGLAAAAELAFHNVRSVIIEPRGEVSHARPRAKTTSPRTMEHFRRWGVADAIRARAPLSPQWNRRVVFCDTLKGSVITEFDNVFGLSAEPHELFAESGQQVPQPVVEEVLREHVVSTGLVDLRLGERAVKVHEAVDKVTVTIERPDGSSYNLAAEYVLGCDGCWSIARESIGATLQGSSAPTSNLNVVFKSTTLRPSMGDAVQYWVLGPEVKGAIGPLDREGTWWAGLSGAGDWCDARQAVRLIAALAGRSESEIDIEVLSTDRWTPRMLLADRFASDRVFLVGESAHLNPPFGGHGFNTCVGDAVNIGWKIAAVLDGWGDRHLLGTYENERRTVAQETIEAAAKNFRASGPGIPRSPELLQATKTEEFHSLGLVLGYSYRDSPIIASTTAATPTNVQTYRPSTEPGGRLPHVWISPGHALYDDLGSGFTLLAPAHADSVVVARFVERAVAQRIPLSVVSTPPGGPWTPDEFLLIRPDQHIAWSGEQLDDADLERAVGRVQTSDRTRA
ncbi:FAD-dependent monooxygenase [Rhodococcus qingshengii]|uniref:FAD-dependent monooxygenase n=1 Tax=Rhodococcus qingshengii TaxID=334542 RepID=UPI002111603A|nr:FAD-dependent monooxygenase [Rhodococcus qingshengii]UUE28611.1 FAD-dependent monooxygenase [Rhodococcus qingshengii]